MQPDKNNNRRCHSDEERGGIPEHHMIFTLGLFRFPSLGFLEHVERGVRVGLLFIFCLLLQSCNWFFHPEEIHISSLKSYEDYGNAMDGVYGLLENDMSNLSFFYPSLMGDDISSLAPNYSYIYERIGCYENTLSVDNSSWENLYKTIASANNIIVQYNKNSDNSIRNLVGEAYIIRAYCYFRLSKIYGRIPLIDDIDVDYTTPLSSFQEVSEFIEADLLTAITLLPSNKEQTRILGVTPHRGTAKALLAELYLYWGGYPLMDASKYQLAAATAEEVIDSAAYFGFKLEDDFADLWKQSNQFTNEAVFGIFITGDLFTTRSAGIYKKIDGEWVFNYPDYYAYDFLSYWATTNQFYNNYPKDYRRDITFFNSIDYYLTNTSNTWVVNHTYIDSIEVDKPCYKLGFRKFFYDMRKENDTITTNSYKRFYYYGIQRIYLYRYAHTLLTYAEAAARSANLNEKAYECLNMIRRRANNVDIYSPSKYDIQTGLNADQFADSVVQERAWELAGEPEGRWFDQIRLGLAGEDPYFDILEDDVHLNPNLEE